MSDKVKRGNGGQFAPGQSGNPAGARRRRPGKKLLDYPNLHRIILEIGSSETEGTVNGKPTRITMFEAAVLRQAAGAAETRLVARDFIDLVKGSAAWVYHEARREAERSKKQAW